MYSLETDLFLGRDACFTKKKVALPNSGKEQFFSVNGAEISGQPHGNDITTSHHTEKKSTSGGL